MNDDQERSHVVESRALQTEYALRYVPAGAAQVALRCAAGCTWFILLSVFALPFARAAEGGGETQVKVHKGTVVIERDGAGTSLSAGQEARLRAGTPAHVKGTDGDTPPAQPITVQWKPGQTVVMADGVGILLRPGTAGSEGQSADGGYAARLSPKGELLVADLLRNRQAVRFPDGSWVHRFAGCELRVNPSGHTTMRMPDGRELAAATPKPDRPVPATKTVAAPKTTDWWKIGVVRVETANGLRVKAVNPGSPAEKAGFQPGDEVVSIEEVKAPSLQQILQRLKAARPSEKIPFTVRRGEQTVVLTVTVGAWD